MNCYVIHVSHHKRNSSITPEMSFVMTKRSPLPVMPSSNQLPRQYNSRAPSLAGTEHRLLWTFSAETGVASEWRQHHASDHQFTSTSQSPACHVSPPRFRMCLRGEIADGRRRTAAVAAAPEGLSCAPHRPCPAAELQRALPRRLHAARSESAPYGNVAYISDVRPATGVSVHPACNMKVRASELGGDSDDPRRSAAGEQ